MITQYAQAEVLRYLGHRGQTLSDELAQTILQCMEKIREVAVPAHVMRRFPLIYSENGCALKDAELTLTGDGILRHLHGCTEAALLAVTLGTGVDNLIRRTSLVDLTQSVILDACATQYIEQCCDDVEHTLCAAAGEDGLSATGRFSPGYGDFHIAVQPAFLAVLDAGRRIGLTCTENDILLPRKSVTAVIGLGEKIENKTRGCAGCNLHGKCRYGRNG